LKESFELRLRRHYRPGILFHDLEFSMYPSDDYPKYWNYASNGGPPGGRMSFSAALKRRGLSIVGTGGRKNVYNELPTPQQNTEGGRGGERFA
jgi:hypothetical protein